MKFLPLCTVQLLHPYYTDGRCPAFDVEPTLATRRLLTNARCMLKAMPNGIRVLAAVTAQGVPLIPLPPGATLTFHLRLDNPDFVLFTDLTDGPPITGTLYTQADLSADDRQHIPLVARRVPRTALAPDVFAAVEIGHDDPLPLTSTAPCVFDVTFTAKQARWIYYVITDQRRTESTWQIVDTATSSAFPLTFSAAHSTNLVQQPDPTDAVAMWLAAQYPTLQRWRFVSDAPIPCQQAARPHLQLAYDGQTAWGTLPNPALHHYTTVAVNSNGTPQPQDALFHILTYFTQPL